MGAPNPKPTEPDFIPPQEREENDNRYWDDEDLFGTGSDRLQQIDGGHSHRHFDAFSFPAPTKGDQPLLVLLVDFPDRPGLFTGEAWSERFFGPGGFANYHREVSYNQLRYSGDIVGLDDGQPAINDGGIAYIELPNPITYYADGNRGFTVTPGQFPQNNGGVVYHALQALDEAAFDFEPYADPESDKVENLIVVYAGSSYAFTNDPDNSLQATGYRLTWAGLGAPFVSQDGYRFDNYTFCPDQAGDLSGNLAFIGVCAHENGHTLGMPDLYDYSFTTTGNGYFDLMAYGTYGYNFGEEPFHYGGFSKLFMNWVTPNLLLSGVNEVTLPPSAEEPALIKLYPNGNPGAGQYFLLENRQPLGFDRYWEQRGLCPGLLIWHIDEQIISDPTLFTNVNSRPPVLGAPPHPGVRVVEADGEWEMISASNGELNYGECEDSWQVGQRWDSESVPPAHLWDGSSTGLSVEILSQSGNDLNLRITITSNLTEAIFIPLLIEDRPARESDE